MPKTNYSREVITRVHWRAGGALGGEERPKHNTDCVYMSEGGILYVSVWVDGFEFEHHTWREVLWYVPTTAFNLPRE